MLVCIREYFFHMIWRWRSEGLDSFKDIVFSMHNRVDVHMNSQRLRQHTEDKIPAQKRTGQEVPLLKKKIFTTDHSWERKNQSLHSSGMTLDINHTPGQAPCSGAGSQHNLDSRFFSPPSTFLKRQTASSCVGRWGGFGRRCGVIENMIKIYCLEKNK